MSADADILADGDFPRAGGEARLILERARRVADWLETEPLAVAAPQELVLRNCRGFTFDRTIFDDCTQNHLQGAEQ